MPRVPGPVALASAGRIAGQQSQAQVSSQQSGSQSHVRSSMGVHLPPRAGTRCQDSVGAVSRWQRIGHRYHLGAQCGEPGDLRVHLREPATQELPGRLARAGAGVPDRQQGADVGQPQAETLRPG